MQGIGLVRQVFGRALERLFALLLLDAKAGRGGGVAPTFVFVDGVFGGVIEVGGGYGAGRRGSLTFGAGVGIGIKRWAGGVVVIWEARLREVLLRLVGWLDGKGVGFRGGVDGEEGVYFREGVIA